MIFLWLTLEDYCIPPRVNFKTKYGRPTGKHKPGILLAKKALHFEGGNAPETIKTPSL